VRESSVRGAGLGGWGRLDATQQRPLFWAEAAVSARNARQPARSWGRGRCHLGAGTADVWGPCDDQSHKRYPLWLAPAAWQEYGAYCEPLAFNVRVARRNARVAVQRLRGNLAPAGCDFNRALTRCHECTAAQAHRTSSRCRSVRIPSEGGNRRRRQKGRRSRLLRRQKAPEARQIPRTSPRGPSPHAAGHRLPKGGR